MADRMAVRRITILIFFLIFGGVPPICAESTRSLINEGNAAYGREDYVGAEVEYRKALDRDNDLVEGNFNLGSSLYKQGKFDGSAKSLDETLDATTDDELAAKAYFNRGNALFKQKMYEESIDSYIHSLKLDPDDMDAKYNLLYARKKLVEQQRQSQQKKSDGQQDENQENRDQEEKRSGDREKKEAEENNRSASQEEEKQQGEEMTGESKPETEDRRISRSEAERILQALKENEKEVQKKLRAKPAGRAGVEKDW